MNCELWFTSAPRGLYPGSTGYTTVKATKGMSPALRQALESFSTYRHLHPPDNGGGNPVHWSYVGLTCGGRRHWVLTRVCDAGLDHTHRSNFFAHHVALDDPPPFDFDPAWFCHSSRALVDHWDGAVEELATPRALPRGNEASRPCMAWEAAAGDAGWAGMAAESLLQGKKVYLVVPDDAAVIDLLGELFGLLPPTRRARITFATDFANLGPGHDCQIRVLRAQPGVTARVPNDGSLCLDLRRRLGLAPQSPAVAAARTGTALKDANSPGAPSFTKDDAFPKLVDDSAAVPPRSSASRAAAPPPASRSVPAVVSHDQTPTAGGLAVWVPLAATLGIVLGVLALLPFLLRTRSRLNESQAAGVDLQQQLQQAQTDVDQKRRKVVQLDEEKNGQSKQIQQLNDQLAAVKRELSEAALREQSLRSQASEKDQRIAALSADLEQSRQRVMQLQQENAQLKSGVFGRDKTVAAAQPMPQVPPSVQSAPVTQRPEYSELLKGPAILHVSALESAKYQDMALGPASPEGARVEIRQPVPNNASWSVTLNSVTIADIKQQARHVLVLNWQQKPDPKAMADREYVARVLVERGLVGTVSYPKSQPKTLLKFSYPTISPPVAAAPANAPATPKADPPKPSQGELVPGK